MQIVKQFNNAVRQNIAKRKLESRKLDSNTSNPLEKWSIVKIKKDISKTNELKNTLNPNSLSRKDIEKYKLIKLREVLKYASKYSPYYMDLYEKERIDPSSIQKLEDLESIPLTDPVALAEKPYHFLCVSRKDIAREFTTSGTTNILKRVSYTQEELLEIVDSVVAGLKMAGMDSEGDTLQIMYPTITATWEPGLVLSKACDLAGMDSVINDSLNAESQISTMKKVGTTVIIGTSSFIYSLSRQIKELGIDPHELGIKRIICSSEPLTAFMKKEIEEIWGCKTLRQWGMTEMGLANAIECTEQDGMHVNNADFLVEVIDPKTGKILPPGEEGELVFTTLRRKCMPLIRYRTRDIATLIDEPCRCGATLDQRIKNIKRIDL
ncbi:phenylacetate--CoA ligase family protein [Methanohalophilus sp. RSK]|uniref:phenylacetate--CoA ligase family protein n=1 Tax=Methanohalophilus sp. RSK TaxID=2485783 RepID=UPI000F43C9EA|nr:AMP-binding protein [Methanohalophilus sp. RSK]RNI13744.1 phenylacetate--CoA ligase family protein [Methanohalophilus sp. RSK]